MSAQTRTLSIIGSSNSRRIFGGHIPHLSTLSGCRALYKGATTLSTGEAACQTLKGKDMAVISFVTNILVEECGSVLEGELDAKIDEVLVKYIEVLKAIPSTVTIIFMYPFPRVEPSWVFESLGFIHNKLDSLLDTLGTEIHRIPYLPVTKDDFETDFIHLKLSVCERQYQGFCASFAEIFNADAVIIDEFELISPSRMDSVPLTSTHTLTSDTESSSVAPTEDLANAGGSVRQLSQWGNILPQLTPNSKRYNSRVQLPHERQSNLKRPATTEGEFYGAKTTRLNNGQSIARMQGDSQQSAETRRQKPNNWNSNPGTSNEEISHSSFSHSNADRSGGNQWASNPEPNGSYQNGQFRGRGGRGRGNASGSNAWGINQPRPGRVDQSTDKTIEVRLTNLEMQNVKLAREMVSNYELTETALNRINVASVIIDCLPFGRSNSNDPAVKVVRELVEALGGPKDDVLQAYFLNVGNPPPRGCFAKIRAIFSSERSAFDFRSEATAARRRRDLPWVNTYVSNDPTKGTKVRVEILQQLAKSAQGTVEGRDAEILVSKFEARPMLLFKRGGRIYKRLIYSEALLKFGRLVRPEAYELARKIAGRDYEGRMGVVFGI